MSNEIFFKGCLFDLDGTLIDSLPAVERVWANFASRYGLEPEHVLSYIHGRTAIEALNHFLEGYSPKDIKAEYENMEWLESEDTEGTVALEGSVGFLERLNCLGIPWAIVTSGTRLVATSRIRASKLPFPDHLITSNDVVQGKPHPEPYLRGAEMLGLTPCECVVFEDAPAGVRSALDAGVPVIGILSHHTVTQLFDVDGINNLSEVQVKRIEHSTFSIEF